MGIFDIIFAVGVIGFIVTSVVKWVFKHTRLKDLDKRITAIELKPWASVVLGILVACQADIDVIALIFHKTDTSAVNTVLTGLLFAGGSNIINDILKKMKKSKDIIDG